MKKQDTSKNDLPDQNQGNPVIISDDEGSPKPSPRENGPSHAESPESEEAGSSN